MSRPVPPRFDWTIAVLCSLALSACRHEDEPEHEHEDPAAEHGEEAADAHADEVTLHADAFAAHEIELAVAARRELRPSFRVPAQIAFNREGMAHVGCPVTGRVASLTARLGDEVAAGAELFVVESPELGEAQSEYLQRRSAARTSVPAVALARNAHERARALFEERQGLPLTEVQKREGELRAAEAAQQAAESAARAGANKLKLLGMDADALARLEASEEVDPRYTVRAPIAGQVIEREVTLGELVGPEREALLILADVSRLWVLADVPEARLSQTAVGAQARVLLGVGEEHWCEGVVAYIAPALDPTTRSVRVRIEALDRHPELRPGVFAQAEIAAARAAASALVLAVPDEAVQTIEGQPSVFVPVEGEPGTFARRALRTGASVGGWVPVLAGLAEGERFVAQGSFLLKAELGKAGATHDH